LCFDLVEVLGFNVWMEWDQPS